MLPVKLLEYVYLGIPSVTPRLMTIEHYFDEKSVAYYKAGDVADLTRAMRDVLGSAERRQALREAAAGFLSRYAWDSMKQDLFKAVDGN